MRCLVTGVAGFIGSHLAERLLAEGHEVCGVDSFADDYSRALKEHNLDGPRSWKRFTLRELDLLEGDLHAIADGIDWVFHLAARAGIRASWGKDFGDYLNSNVLATQRLLEALKHQSGVQRFVFASSSSIYGDAGLAPVRENTLPQPYSPYGLTKLAAEYLCMLYSRNFGIPVVSLRYFSVYGPRQRPDMALHRFCQAFIEHQPLSIFGNGKQGRNFTFVDDVVEATLRAATSDTAIGEALNIACDERTTLREAIETLREISNVCPACIYEPAHYGDVQNLVADTARAQKVLGYTPQTSLRTGLARQFAEIVARSPGRQKQWL